MALGYWPTYYWPGPAPAGATSISNWYTTLRAGDWRSTNLSTVRQGDVDREVDNDEQSIVVVRAGASLTAQSVRILFITWPPRGNEAGGAGGEQAEDSILVLGGPSLDIQRGDRFSVSGSWYEVLYVAPAQLNRTEALARQMQ